jgi:polar amino acid transport system substrate-binding protein
VYYQGILNPSRKGVCMAEVSVDYLPSAPLRFARLHRLGWRVAMLGGVGIAWGSWFGVAAAESPSLRVAVKPIPPFVYTDGPIPRGFSVDLWKEIAEVIGVHTEFVVEETVEDLLALAEEGRVDAAIAAVTINSDREARVDFSHPYYRSGLRIGVPTRHGPTLVSTISRFLSPDLFAMLAMLTALTLVAAHLLWLIERGVNPECFPSRYVSGVGEALWWSVATIITGGCENKAPISLFGRLVAVAWMLGSIVLVAAFTATLSSQMTTESVAGAISGPDGLPGRKVATVRGSSAVKSLRNLRASVREFSDLAAAMGGVSGGEAEALVFDAPVLAHAVTEDPRSPIRLVGPLFEHQDYGIVLPRGSDLRKSVNQAMLTLVENGTIGELNVRWFGEMD